MTITARNIGRINVWPTYDDAREADTEESEFVCQLTVYRTNAEARDNLTSGGGGGTPDWVPENALIHIDLVGGDPQGRAWVDGVGEVAVDTLLGMDPDSSNYWDDTEYDPADLTAYGYEKGSAGANKALGVIGPALALIVAGATVRVRFNKEAANTSYVLISNDLGDFAVTVEANSDGRLKAYADMGGLNTNQPGIINDGAGDATVNVVAFTYVPASRLDVAANGSAAFAGVLTNDDAPLHVVTIDTLNAVASITLYAALPSTDGLSELSEVA